MADQTVIYRKDDGKILISTDAYVSHYKHSGPRKSTFSMTVAEAEKLIDDINTVLDSPY